MKKCLTLIATKKVSQQIRWDTFFSLVLKAIYNLAKPTWMA